MELKKCRVFGKYKFFYLENDKYIGQRIALEKYEPYETQLILRQTKKGDVVVDVGANIGYYTVLLADKVGKTGKVYAFEPDIISFEILKKNIEANNLKNVVAINVGVGSKNETKMLYKSEENLGDHKLFNDQFLMSNVQKTQNPPVGKPTSSLNPPKADAFRRAGEREAIKIIKLDDYLADIKVNLIKIDTQGWEPEVVEGAKEIIKKNKPIIFMEYSPASYSLAKLDGQNMMKFLRSVYPKCWWIDEWLYIYKNLSQEKIDQICATNKTGYADLWMKKKFDYKDLLGRYRNIKIKQWVKKLFGGL